MKRACSFMHMESVEECQDEMDALEVRHQKEVHALKARMAKLEQTKIEGDEEGTTRRDIIVQDGRIRKGRLNSEDNESLVAPLPRGRCSEVACSRESVESIERARMEEAKKSVSPSKRVKMVLRSTFKNGGSLKPICLD
uniref:Uncharacterized protein n=1 Tax=Leptocylindrus danicus TaxID=163516 RepID=A0A7S2L9P0_9STRA|mmetsp:Transcript_3380/g.4908  ORF Transcript_3380/g.4908 Transcript_3380/m.4908 type:complete len:139 (+) Transcript_3380:3-419(+)